MRKNKNLIYITGPTGVGKTDLSIEIAKKFKTDIVSCDSRQFYKELKIGTSPPSNTQLSEVKHHFIHNKSIHDKYNVGVYEKDAIDLINKIFSIKDYLILVGGSGLYADSVIYGIDSFPEVPQEIRDNIRISFEKNGIKYLQKKIEKLDPKYYSKVDLNNSSRLLRALELIEFTGKSFSSMRSGKAKERNFNTQIISLDCSREYLYSRINNRVDKMIDEGLEKEVFELKQFKNLNTMNTVGYKEFINYFENNVSYEEAVNKIKQNTRNYAKRQITWFKRYKNCRRINIEENYNLDIKNLNI